MLSISPASTGATTTMGPPLEKGATKLHLSKTNPKSSALVSSKKNKDLLKLLPAFRPLNEKPTLKGRNVVKENISSIKPRYRKEDKSLINRKLYYDVFSLVLKNLEVSDLIVCSEVCVRWNGIIKYDKESQRKIALFKKYIAEIAPHKVIGFDHWRYHTLHRTRYIVPRYVDISSNPQYTLTDVNEALLFFIAQRFRAQNHRPISPKEIMLKTGVHEWRSLTPIEYIKFLKNPARQEIFGKTWRRLGFPKNARDLGERAFCQEEARVGGKVYRLTDYDRYRILLGFIEQRLRKLSPKKR